MNFAGDLLRSVGGKLGTAAKSILGAPGSASIDLFGTNVPLVPLISYRDHFLRMLSTWSGSIPNQFMFLVLIDNFPQAINTNLMHTYEPIGEGDKIGNNIDKNYRVTTNAMYQRIAGCVFAQGVNIPGEQVSYKQEKIPNARGFLPGLAAGVRGDPMPLTIQFLETNTSFIDFVIRPWTILAGHLGLVARPGDIPEEGMMDSNNIKTNITIIQLAKTYQGRSSVQRKVWRFYNCVPYRIPSQEVVTTGAEAKIFNSEWYYTNYTVGGLPFVPIEEIIKSFSSGSIPNIINGITQITGIDPIQKAKSLAKKILKG